MYFAYGIRQVFSWWGSNVSEILFTGSKTQNNSLTTISEGCMEAAVFCWHRPGLCVSTATLRGLFGNKYNKGTWKTYTPFYSTEYLHLIIMYMQNIKSPALLDWCQSPSWMHDLAGVPEHADVVNATYCGCQWTSNWNGSVTPSRRTHSPTELWIMGNYFMLVSTLNSER